MIFKLLPEEILLKIVFSLSADDVLNLSKVSSYLYHFLNQEELWKKVLKKGMIHISTHVEKLSLGIIEKFMLPETKIKYLAVKKLHSNWLGGKGQKKVLMSSYDRITLPNLV